VQPNSSMIPLGRKTRKHGGTAGIPGSAFGPVKETTLACVSGAVCHAMGPAVIDVPLLSS
jgi:hypothetical protein